MAGKKVPVAKKATAAAAAKKAAAPAKKAAAPAKKAAAPAKKAAAPAKKAAAPAKKATAAAKNTRRSPPLISAGVAPSPVRIPTNPRKGQKVQRGGGCSDGVAPVFAPVGSKVGYAMGMPSPSESSSVPLCGSAAVAAGMASGSIPTRVDTVMAGSADAGMPFNL